MIHLVLHFPRVRGSSAVPYPAQVAQFGEQSGSQPCKRYLGTSYGGKPQIAALMTMNIDIYERVESLRRTVLPSEKVDHTIPTQWPTTTQWLGGRALDEADFAPLFERMANYDLPILLHPAGGADFLIIERTGNQSTRSGGRSVGPVKRA